ncbi:MAG TPA: hypothetical protein VG326_10155 [Tepidisphaeraceae bacterium]|nr:hypothetical protein [Tepidisphaeraceae bacterium]
MALQNSPFPWHGVLVKSRDMNSQPATKRSVVLVIVLAVVSVTFLAIAIKGDVKKGDTRKPPAGNFLQRALDVK